MCRTTLLPLPLLLWAVTAALPDTGGRPAFSTAAAAGASSASSGGSSSFPLAAPMMPPRWWERGGHLVRGIWPKCALGEGLSEAGQMWGLPAFMAMLDRLHASNISTLQMVVYDSGDGYDADDLWCGLAGSNYSKPLANIGSEADWHTFIDAAHSRNMTVTSFWNAAYFWTGSPYFKQAEADIRAHGLDDLPESSPARWFRWSARKAKHIKPADDQPNTNWCSDWVWDPEVNASYYGGELDTRAHTRAHTRSQIPIQHVILLRGCTVLAAAGDRITGMAPRTHHCVRPCSVGLPTDDRLCVSTVARGDAADHHALDRRPQAGRLHVRRAGRRARRRDRRRRSLPVQPSAHPTVDLWRDPQRLRRHCICVCGNLFGSAAHG
jgi:hypothetical protein